MDKKDDFVDDDVVNIIWIFVLRQIYIVVFKVELVFSFVILFFLFKDVLMFFEIFVCLEFVIYVEYKSVFEEFCMDYWFVYLDVVDKKFLMLELDLSNVDRQGIYFLEWDFKEWWRRILEKVMGLQKNISEVDGVFGVVDSFNENGWLMLESSDSFV